MSRGRAWLVALVATLAMSVSYVDCQVVAAVATSVRKSLDIDATQFGWLAGAFSLAYLVAAPLAGAAIDRAGARRGLAVAVLAWSAVSAAHALAPSFAGLFALRILLGTAEAPSFPAAAQSVRRALPPRDRSAAFGLLFTGSSIGAAVAAPLAIWLDVNYGWRTAFLVASLLGTLWIPLWLAVTRGAGVRAALDQGDAHGNAGSRPAPAAPTGAVFSNPGVVRALVLVLASAPALMFIYLWLPQYFELGRHLPKETLGRYLWLPPLMGDAGMLAFGALASRIDRRHDGPRSHVELVLAAAALEATMALVPLASSTWSATVLVGLGAAGAGGLYTLLTADMMARVDPSRVSLAGGLTAASQSLVYVTLSPAVGHWFDRTGSFDVPIVALAALAVPGALAWAAWPVRRAVGLNPAR